MYTYIYELVKRQLLSLSFCSTTRWQCCNSIFTTFLGFLKLNLSLKPFLRLTKKKQFGVCSSLNLLLPFVMIHFFFLPFFVGWSLGEHGEWAKYSNFDVATQVPLIFYVPGITAHREGFRESTFPLIDILTHSDYSFKSKIFFLRHHNCSTESSCCLLNNPNLQKVFDVHAKIQKIFKGGNPLIICLQTKFPQMQMTMMKFQRSVW